MVDNHCKVMNFPWNCRHKVTPRGVINNISRRDSIAKPLSYLTNSVSNCYHITTIVTFVVDNHCKVMNSPWNCKHKVAPRGVINNIPCLVRDKIVNVCKQGVPVFFGTDRLKGIRKNIIDGALPFVISIMVVLIMIICDSSITANGRFCWVGWVVRNAHPAQIIMK